MKVRTGLLAGQKLGDALADFTDSTGVAKLAQEYERITGKPCGCKERQEKFNKISLPAIRMMLA